MESSRRIRVGYGLAPKKQSTIITPSLVSYAAERGVDLVLIDAARRLCDQGPFDCVIHKLYDEGWRSQLRDFANRNPGVPIIDSLEPIERTHNRVSMLEVVSELRIPPGKETLGVPEQVVIHNSEVLSDPNSLASVRFPVIVKPLLATGGPGSHGLSLCFNREALLQLKLESPVVVQEFVNHGGVIFKVYVIGDHVECVKRKSLPDVTEEDPQHHQRLVPFSSVSNTTISTEMEKHFEECRMPSLDFIMGLSKELTRVMGLHLFNFDVIRDMRACDRYLVIDINYFPGYWKMPNYEGVFTDFFLEIVQKTRLDVMGGSGSNS